MSKRANSGTPQGGRGTGKTPEPSPKARRKQIIVGLIMGAVMGLVISAISQFWLWLPAGLAVGLAAGAIMKPPAE